MRLGSWCYSRRRSTSSGFEGRASCLAALWVAASARIVLSPPSLHLGSHSHVPFLTLRLNKTFDTLLFCSPLKARQIFHYRKNKKQKHIYWKKEVYLFDPCLTFEIFTLQQAASLSFLLQLCWSNVALFFLGISACPFGLPFSRGYCPSLT